MTSVEETKPNSNENHPRLCHIIKNPQFDGYGFNLHAEKNKPGQYIGKVDEGSPAEQAGLREGDRILEVNGVDISKESHKQVVQRIKTNPNETKLLLVSPNESSTPIVTITPSSENNSHDSVDLPEHLEQKHENHENGNGATNATNANSANNTNNANNTTNSTNTVSKNSSPSGTPLKLNMSVAEMRAQLANKKKYDPKKESIDFKQKFDIVQKL